MAATLRAGFAYQRAGLIAEDGSTRQRAALPGFWPHSARRGRCVVRRRAHRADDADDRRHRLTARAYDYAGIGAARWEAMKTAPTAEARPGAVMTTLPVLGYLSGALLHALVDTPTFLVTGSCGAALADRAPHAVPHMVMFEGVRRDRSRD